MLNNKLNPRVLVASFMIVSICTACIITFKYADSFTEYEIENSPERHTSHKRIAVNQTTEQVPDDIPDSHMYSLYLYNDILHVYTASDELVYTEKLKNSEMLSQNDKTELEQSGMIFTTRSQLIEMLNYLNS